ncbi:hypothetical protein ACHWQZ_G019368 [Mnemiopsis leidyi]
MESILDEIDSMIGELDDINFSPNHKKEVTKKDPDALDIKDGTANGGQNFSDLINELAAFNPTPAAKEKTLTRGASTDSMTTHQLMRGGSLRSRSEEKESSRKVSIDSSPKAREREKSVTSSPRNHGDSVTSRDSSGSISRKRSLSRQNTLENFTLIPSPSENIKIHMADGNMIKTVRVERSQTAWDLCLCMVLKNDLPICGNWTLVERIVNNGCERTLEDHEVVIKVYKSWGPNSQNRLSLVNNNKKWQFLETPEMFFSSNVLDRVRGRSRDEIEEVLTEEYFSEKAPPVEGYLHFKDQKHNWGRKYFILRSSGLYYSTKGKSRAPQDLACFTTLQDMSIYFCVNAKTDHKSPTEHAISFKPGSGNVSMKDMKCVAAETEEDILRWYHALRVVKHGDKIPENRAVVLLEVTQEIERVHNQKKLARDAAIKKEEEEKMAIEEEEKKIEEERIEKEKMMKEEERKNQQRLGAVPPKPDLSKKPSPPPPSPKPSRAALQKPAASPKPVPSPKPDLRKKMHLPVPPAKPRTESPASSRSSTPQLPRTQQSATPPPPPQFSQPPKPLLPQQIPPPVNPPPILPVSTVDSSKEFTPNKAGFADAQAQLARSLNGTIKRGSIKHSTKPNPSTSHKSTVSGPPQTFQPTSPPVNNLPDPVDDLPPPPPEVLGGQQQVPIVPAPIPDRPDINATPSRSKIAAMVKNLNAPQKAVDKTVLESQSSESSGRNNVSELTSMLNRTLKKSQTTSGLTNQHSTPQKPNHKPNMSNMPRSLTCPQIDVVSQPHPAAPAQRPVPAGSVHDRAAELAKVMSGKAPPRQSPVLPAQSPFANQPPLPPPKQFSSGAPPPPRAFSQNNTPAFQPNSAPPARQPPSTSRPIQPPPQPPGPMRAPPPAIPPAANYTTPALPSRKDSLMASRNRTTSGSSGGSHGSSARGGSVASHAGSQEPPGFVRPPPRTISRDNLRASSRNGHRGSRENLAMNTATTVNTSSEHGIPDIFQRGGIPGGHPGMPGRENSPQPPPRQDIPGQRPPNIPLHFPPQRFNNPAPSGRGRDSPARGWHDTLMRDNSPIEGPREQPLAVSINDIRQIGQPGLHPRQFGGSSPMNGTLNSRPGHCNPGSSGSGASEEVMYEYIEDVPCKREHLQHWLTNQYDDDTISVNSDNMMMMTSPLTPPPRSNSRRPNTAPHLQKPWFHGCIPREAANSLLAAHGLTDGLFLVRSSASSSGDFVLSMTHGGQVKHFQITQRGGSPPWYAIEDGPCFPDINKLVDHYSASADRLPSKLSCYCLKG